MNEDRQKFSVIGVEEYIPKGEPETDPVKIATQVTNYNILKLEAPETTMDEILKIADEKLGLRREVHSNGNVRYRASHAERIEVKVKLLDGKEKIVVRGRGSYGRFIAERKVRGTVLNYERAKLKKLFRIESGKLEVAVEDLEITVEELEAIVGEPSSEETREDIEPSNGEELEVEIKETPKKEEISKIRRFLKGEF